MVIFIKTDLMITHINQLDLSKEYTYADYVNWQFDESVELIRGKVIRISPAPNTLHQSCSGNLHGLIWSYLRDKSYRSFTAPFDVRLPLPITQQADNKVNTVVQPDLCVICDVQKLDDRGCNGAPDWVIEILSKGTAQKDLKDKFTIYQHAGVREYWIVHPIEGTVLPYRLNETGTYQLLRQTPFTREETVPVGIFPGFGVDLEVVFGD